MDQELFLLGDDFMPWMVLAFGAAMVVGNLAAMFRPPSPDERNTKKGAQHGKAQNKPQQVTTKPPVIRSVVMIVIGGVAAIWGAVSLLS